MFTIEDLERAHRKQTPSYGDTARDLDPLPDTDSHDPYKWLPASLRTGGALSPEAVALLVERSEQRKDAHLGAVRD